MWLIYSILAGIIAVILELTYYKQVFPNFLALLPIMIIPMLILQWALFRAYRETPIYILAWAVFFITTAVGRIIASCLMGQPLTIKSAVAVGLCIVAAFLLKV